AHAQVTHVRVAHHARRQAHTLARRLDQSVRILLQQLVVERHLRERDGVTLTRGAIAEAVKDDERERAALVIQNYLSPAEKSLPGVEMNRATAQTRLTRRTAGRRSAVAAVQASRAWLDSGPYS